MIRRARDPPKSTCNFLSFLSQIHHICCRSSMTGCFCQHSSSYGFVLIAKPTVVKLYVIKCMNFDYKQEARLYTMLGWGFHKYPCFCLNAETTVFNFISWWCVLICVSRIHDMVKGPQAVGIVEHPCARSYDVEMKEDFRGYNVTSPVRHTKEFKFSSYRSWHWIVNYTVVYTSHISKTVTT